MGWLCIFRPTTSVGIFIVSLFLIPNISTFENEDEYDLLSDFDAKFFDNDDEDDDDDYDDFPGSWNLPSTDT